MSVILKSPLRLVGTAKYATNNLTQYLRAQEPPNNSFILLTSHSPSDYRSVTFHHTQAKIKSKNFWEWMRVSANKIFTPKLPYKNETSSTILGNFFVKQSSGTIELITNNKRQKNFIFPAVFTAKYNGELIAVESDTIASEEKGPISFRAGGLNLLLDGDKLKFKVKDSDETFILNHAVHITALKKPTQILKGGGIKILPSAHIDDVTAYDAELTLKTPKNEEHKKMLRTVNFNYSLFRYAAAAAAADYPGRVKLQFPMDLSLQGFKHIIKVKETGETNNN
ncbi:hypothetical protein HCN44_006881 [Aphidius gifuensis]|uniref:Uncharacterized protein n=1 Tax=Aphidius gifuensis TaxID=684658 RepID=A0A835CTA2_APHGI|nr:hypothetical protein HCN44_006881 [Aphidius gifuensis]